MSKKKKLATYPPGGPSFGEVQEGSEASIGDGSATVTAEYDSEVFTDVQIESAIAAFIEVLDG